MTKEQKTRLDFLADEITQVLFEYAWEKTGQIIANELANELNADQVTVELEKTHNIVLETLDELRARIIFKFSKLAATGKGPENVKIN